MNQQAKVGARRVVWVALLLVSTLFWFIAFRFVSFPFLIVTWTLFAKVGRRDLRPSLLAWTVWLALSFSPIDVFPIPKGDRRGLFR